MNAIKKTSFHVKQLNLGTESVMLGTSPMLLTSKINWG